MVLGQPLIQHLGEVFLQIHHRLRDAELAAVLEPASILKQIKTFDSKTIPQGLIYYLLELQTYKE